MSRIDELIEKLCPDGVEFKSLGNVLEILNGFSFKSGKYSKEGIRVIRITDVQKGRISNKDIKFYPLNLKSAISKYLLKTDDLVMSLTGNTGRVAMISENDLPAGLNQRVACLRPKNDILIRYVFHILDTDEFEKIAMENSTGGGQQNLSTTWLATYKIPVPPLIIQEKIVEILEQFTQLHTELETELEARKAQYQFYRNQLLAFENKEVDWKFLEEVCKNINAGGDLPKNLKKDQDTASKEFPYPIFANAVEKNGLYGFTDCYKIESDSVTIAARGAKIGFHVVREGKYTPIVRLISLIPNKNFITTRFLNYVLDITEIAGTKGGIPQLTVPTVKRIRIPVPPLAEQERIVKILDQFDDLVNNISSGLPAEIKARRQQYEYYRAKLLTFKVMENH